MTTYDLPYKLMRDRSAASLLLLGDSVMCLTSDSTFDGLEFIVIISELADLLMVRIDCQHLLPSVWQS